MNDIRHLVPKLGLRNYWYPAVRANKVGARRPMKLALLGEELCLFRGTTGEVAAIRTPLSTVTTACAVAAAFVVLVATTWKTPEYAGAVYSPAWVTAPPFASATLQATCTVVGDNVNC